jgi:hypothetical protein
VSYNSSESAASISEVFVASDGTTASVASNFVSSKNSAQLSFSVNCSGGTVTLSAASTSGSNTTVNAYRTQLGRPPAASGFKVIDSWSASSYRMAKYIIAIKGTDINEYDSLEVWENNLEWHEFKKLLETQEMINNTNASIRNSVEVIESLIKITKGKKYIFSWDNMDIKSNYIEDKDDINNKLNMWETYGDVYNETNGLKGFNGDFHWSDKMNYQFSKYIINLINNG